MPINTTTHFGRPPGLLAGFHAILPDPSVPELIHTGEQWASRRFFVSNHSHTVWEFYLQISGESRWDAPDRTYTLAPGGFFATPPHLPHQMHDLPDDKHHFYFAAFDLSAFLMRLPALASLWQRETIVFLPRGETLLPPFRQLIREVSLTLPHREAGMRLALEALALEASRLLEASERSSSIPQSLTLSHPAVRLAKELMDHQPGRSWRLADLGADSRHFGPSSGRMLHPRSRRLAPPVSAVGACPFGPRDADRQRHRRHGFSVGTRIFVIPTFRGDIQAADGANGSGASETNEAIRSAAGLML